MPLLILIIVGLLIGLHALIDGFVLSHLWNWFAVPTLGVRPLGMAAAYGLTLIVSYMRANRRRDKEKKGWIELVEAGLYAAVASAFFGAMTLGLGAVVRGLL